MELPILSDGVVTLRPRRLEDADAVTAACQDPEIPRWTTVPSPYTREHAVEWLSTPGPDMAQFFAVDAEDRLLGSFSVMEIDRDRLPEPANTGSCRVAERAGFTPTGERRALPRDPAGEVKYAVYRWRAP